MRMLRHDVGTHASGVLSDGAAKSTPEACVPLSPASRVQFYLRVTGWSSMRNTYGNTSLSPLRGSIDQGGVTPGSQSC